MMGAVAVAASAAAGGAFGWFGLPWASDALLRRAHARADAWWRDSLDAYRDFKRAHPDREPRSSAPGLEGALGIWRDEALSGVLAGALTEERLRALAGVGIKVDGLAAAGDEAERARRRLRSPRWRDRVLGSLALALGFSAVSALAPNALSAMALGLCLAAMAMAVVCDARSRLIPLEACGLVAAAGAGFQLATCGVSGAAAGAAFALAAVAGCSLANRLLRFRCPVGAVGRGDVRCMGALALATGTGAACGFAACYALAGLVALGGVATGRLTLKDGLPMAPFLSVWLVCGAAASIAFR